MGVADLRARALTRTRDAVLRLSLCLDEALIAELQQASAAYAQARAHGEDDPDVDSAEVAAIEVARLQDLAEDATIVLTFRRLDPAGYDQLVHDHSTDGQVDPAGFYPALCRACYLSASSIDGEFLELSWDDLEGRVLSHGDRDHLSTAVLTHNRASSILSTGTRRP